MNPPLILELPRLSDHSLRIHDQCARKFALRYQLNRYWPAVDPGLLDARSQERRDLGAMFHRLVETRALGLDPELLLKAGERRHPGLRGLWETFVQSGHAALPEGAQVWTEQALHFNFGGAPFMVIYDRLIKQGDTWTILDWKTGAFKGEEARHGWQTKLYLFALVEAGEVLGHGPIAPEAISLVYWEVASARALTLDYDRRTHDRLGVELTELADRLIRPFDPHAEDDGYFPRKRASCPSCGFDTLCNGERAFPAPPEPPLPRFRSDDAVGEQEA